MDEVSEASEWLSKARRRLGWSAADVARKIEAISERQGEGTALSQQAVSNFENGQTKSIPKWYRFARIAIEDADGVANDKSDMVPLAEVDMSYGMGGAFVEEAPLVTIHQFPRLWVETITSSPSSCLYIARGRGSSMEPTMRDGDMLVIDRSERVVRDQDDLWAFTIGEIGMVKRLRIRGDRVTILSDNPIVPDDVAHPDEINILGKVIFVGRRM